MKSLIKKLVPQKLLLAYHYAIALIAAIYYGFPAKKMIVIGITGTKGKTSTANFVWSVLTAGGYKTGIITTANIRIGEKEILNKYHMTMPGRFTIQKILAQMVKEGCVYCIVETTSQGIKQYRHIGVYYDIAVFTNLTPEHIESHGSLESYKQAKGKMFATLSTYPHKMIGGKKIEKLSIVNGDSEHAQYFSSFNADKKYTFSLKNKSEYQAQNVHNTPHGVSFGVGKSAFELNILGSFNVYNALPAIIIAKNAGIPENRIVQGLKNLTLIPGRMEIINEGQDFTVIVDYAHEKQSITGVLDTAQSIKAPGNKTIIIVGAEGGGRDKAKRPLMGELSAQKADVVVVTNVDPYDDDPQEIIEDIARAAEKFGKIRDKDLFTIEDRREGIRKALSLAQKGDIVLITSKGAEQSMIIKGKSIPWDDRVVTREELRKLGTRR